ncbi:uncharacterized protein BYT42DRAFT_591013, partial [Radiomyces spectabilis]|uniref:uncharacterized protein n=1 Tax=Radiomyces spectabilis TaxID=64574 RepID=UPI00221FF8B4
PINYLTVQVTIHHTELDQIHHLLEENQQLHDENTQLKAQLAATTASASKPTVPISAPNTEAVTCLQPLLHLWALMNSPGPLCPKKIRSPHVKHTFRSLAASVCTFKEAEGPSAFQIPDITFPAHSYHSSVLATLEKHTIKPFLDLDPLAPVHLTDPKIKSLPLEEQHLFTETLHYSRCEKAMARLPYHLASPTARSFLKYAIFNEADVSRILSSCQGAPISSAKEKASNPDIDMVNAKREHTQAHSSTL